MVPSGENLLRRPLFGRTVPARRQAPGGTHARNGGAEGMRGLVAGRRAGFVAACVLVAAAAAGCTSGSSQAAPPTTTVPAFTAPSSTTTIPDLTVAPSTTAPPTTIDPAVAVEAEVRAALDRGFADFSACLVALPACDPVTLAATRGGELFERNARLIQEWNEAGYAVRDREQFRHVVEDVELNPDLTEATVLVCWADGSKLVLPGAGPDGVDVIVDGVFVSARETWALRLDADGVWRSYGAELVGPTEGADICRPA